MKNIHTLNTAAVLGLIAVLALLLSAAGLWFIPIQATTTEPTNNSAPFATEKNDQKCPQSYHAPKLDHTLASLLGGSDLTYAFAALRRALSANDKLPRNHPKKFDVQESELIRDSLNEQENEEMMSRINGGVTGEALRRFILLNEDFANHIIRTLGDAAVRNVHYYLSHLETIDASLVEFDDQFAKKQLVYGITINQSDKRITVFFRGTVPESRDWATNMNARQRRLDCPQEVDPSDFGTKDIKVHRGVFNYLNQNVGQERISNKKEDKQDIVLMNPNKFAKIERRLQQLLSKDEFRDFEVYVSGHSLGGALAELLAFQLVGNGSLKGFCNPRITAVTYASPGVGNHGFREAFEQMEDNNLIRHIRVSNAGDPVPAVLGAFAEYTHTGLNLHVSRDSKMLITGDPQERKDETIASQFRHAWRENKSANPFGFLRAMSEIHKPFEYNTNLFGNEWNNMMLRTKTVEHLYEEFKSGAAKRSQS